MLNIIMGALVGILLYRIFSRVYSSSVARLLFKVTELYCLQLLVWSYEDMIFLKETKKEVMRELEIPENQIKISINIDEVNIKKWKREAIKKLLLRYPDIFRSHVEYHDWNSAMRYLEKVIKNT